MDCDSATRCEQHALAVLPRATVVSNSHPWPRRRACDARQQGGNEWTAAKRRRCAMTICEPVSNGIGADAIRDRWDGAAVVARTNASGPEPRRDLRSNSRRVREGLRPNRPKRASTRSRCRGRAGGRRRGSALSERSASSAFDRPMAIRRRDRGTGLSVPVVSAEVGGSDTCAAATQPGFAQTVLTLEAVARRSRAVVRFPAARAHSVPRCSGGRNSTKARSNSAIAGFRAEPARRRRCRRGTRRA